MIIWELMMFGVVLWRDVSENKAVFWCEDQGDLAFFHAATEYEEAGVTFFDAGDLVQFDVYVDCKLRKARNPRIIREKADIDLPARLLDRAVTRDGCRQSAEVLPFPSRTQRPLDSHKEQGRLSS